MIRERLIAEGDSFFGDSEPRGTGGQPAYWQQIML